jgi:hypothetical protein
MRFLVPLVLVAGVAHGQTIEGLYRPVGPEAASWSCNPDDLGMDLGALGIVDDQLYGLEKTCTLTNPRPRNGGTQFTAICSAEGESYSDDYFIAPTDTGVSLTSDGATTLWRRCDSQVVGDLTGGTSNERTSQPAGKWSFEDGVASIVSDANYLELSCEILTASSTYPVARLSGPCPMCFDGDKAQFRFSVDGASGETFEFEKRSNAEGFRSDLYYSSNWFDGLLVDLMAGQVLTVFEGNSEVASFSLTGSTDALGKLRDGCQ